VPVLRRWKELLLACAALGSLPGSAFAEAIAPDARKLIRQVRDASSTSDFAALRQLMVREFQWSFGGDRDAEQALEAWKADAKYLRSLARVTAQPCANVPPAIVECPAAARTSFRAGFERTPAGWRMIYFVEGD
jgi:hypothetical protein